MNKKVTVAELTGSAPQRSKYGVRTDAAGKAERTYNGVVYDSKAEMQFAMELDIRLKAGDIEWWKRQVPFALKVPIETDEAQPDWRIKVATYIADFVYKDRHYGPLHVVDIKGMILPVARLKMKMFEAQYGLKVEIVKRTSNVATGLQ